MTEQQPAYTVLNTQDSRGYDETNNPVRTKRVNVRFADGTQTFVEVPFRPGWTEKAQEAIDEHYAQHQEIMSTQGPMVEVPRRQPRQMGPGG